MASSAESEILYASREQAKAVLASSAAEARRILDDAHREAVELLLNQQKAAAVLLVGEEQAATTSRAEAVAKVVDATQEDGEAALARHDAIGADLRARQGEAARLLMESQRAAAETLSDAVERASSDVLIKGQRDAAAILLDARMRVEELRSER